MWVDHQISLLGNMICMLFIIYWKSHKSILANNLVKGQSPSDEYLYVEFYKWNRMVCK